MKEEEKSQFFALYWGQRVLCNIKQDSVRHMVTQNIDFGTKGDYLLLKSVWSITNQDLEKLGFKKDDQIDCNEFGWMSKTAKNPHYIEWSRSEVDIIRSLGYALPWKDYLLGHLIKEGLIKLQE